MNTHWCCLLRLGILHSSALSAALALSSVFFVNSTLAQELKPIADDSLGVENSQVIPINSLVDKIDGGAIREKNLFHSFSQFNISEGREAYFTNPSGVENILSRVTGSGASQIFGKLGVLGNGNLFLINPNGIIFGPNAKLDIRGSFIGSTASSINFADGTQFSTTPLQGKPLLTVTAPVGLGIGSSPGEIKVTGPGHDIAFDYIKTETRPPGQSSVPGLELLEGKTLALVGGQVSLDGGVLKSPAGRVEIGSVGSNGTVSLIPVQQGWKLNYEGASSFRDIQFSGKSFVDVTGTGGGSIAVTGRNISLTQQSILLADTLGDRNGQEITIVGNSILVNESDINSKTFSSGNAGQVKLVANKSILLENRGGAGTHTQGLGKAGEITLKADSIEIRNRSGLGSNTFGAGNAGRITVRANNLLIENSGFGTASNAEGNAGEINIVVGNFAMRNKAGLNVEARDIGHGGQINITADSLLIENDSGLTSSALKGSTGQAGEMNINVAGSLIVRNKSSINNNTFSTGNAGKINITANSLLIEDKSSINSVTHEGSTGQGGEININVAGPLIARNESSINSNTSGTGDAGKINITANSLLIEQKNSQFVSDTKYTGQGGEININVAGPLTVRNRSGISSKTFGTGNAGKISITAPSLLIENSWLTNNTEKNSTGNAGEININIAGPLKVRNLTGITSKTVGTGNAGKIIITANSMLIEDKSGFSSGTDNTGQAGEIIIKVAGPLVFLNDAGMDSSTSGAGDAGQITVTAESLEISNDSDISIKSTGTGNAGNLYVRVKTLELDNQSRIDATTSSGNGGNLTLDIANLVLLRRGSRISATAGTAQQGGDGGNITINAPNGFIVAVPNENSDISSNAYTGKGGRVDIKAFNTYGIQPRQSPTPLSDITASSDFGIDGTVELKVPDVDPNRGLVELPTNLVGAEQQIATGCNARDRQSSSFFATGRSGLPLSPSEPLRSRAVITQWVALSEQTQSQGNEKVKPASLSKHPDNNPQSTVEAQGWVVDKGGNIYLVAQKPNFVSQEVAQVPVECH
ncbi:MAG: S-layer family protein [Calothrix sp. FI2-JRJ7]|jgi:filamentous hemagglutinin family protein|nr:S-layer family protein [Calothrix sp. FI2-JRJ7]